MFVTDSDSLLAEFDLSNGLKVLVNDASSHYFGGYFHVRLLVRAEVPLNETYFADSATYLKAVELIGEVACFERTLEKMAVPEKMRDIVRQQLLVSFRENLLPYLERPDFAARFVCSQYELKLKTNNKFISRVS